MTDALPVVPNATLVRFLTRRGVDVEAIRKGIQQAASELGKGNAVSAEFDGIGLIVERGCVFVAEVPTKVLKVEIGSAKG